MKPTGRIFTIDVGLSRIDNFVYPTVCQGVYLLFAAGIQFASTMRRVRKLLRNRKGLIEITLSFAQSHHHISLQDLRSCCLVLK